LFVIRGRPEMPITASTLQIEGNQNYQHCKLQPAQASFTKPDSDISTATLRSINYAGLSLARRQTKKNARLVVYTTVILDI